MSKRWYFLGRVAFWLSWPVSHVLLRFGSRTRVLICVEEEVLLVKGIVSGGKWSMPGGGLHKNEEPIMGALRETKEETGINLQADQLSFKGTFKGVNSEKHRYTYHVFTVRLPNKPTIIMQAHEIQDTTWMHYREAQNSTEVSSIAREIISSWYPK
jgi:8-oxo-dGTP pyrophosphatase MutT (NUDIX family)